MKLSEEAKRLLRVIRLLEELLEEKRDPFLAKLAEEELEESEGDSSA